jgi:hypothetical protein
MKTLKTLLYSAIGLGMANLVSIYVYSGRTADHESETTQVIDKETAQQWVNNWTGASKAVYISPAMLNSLNSFLEASKNNSGGVYLYYAQDEADQQKLIMFKSKDGAEASSNYYYTTRKSNDIKLCPPICDMSSPLHVQE